MENTNNNQSRICKICSKHLANGKAMGGHMRSHLAKLPIPPKPNSPLHLPHPKSPPSSFSSSMHYSYRSQNHHELITAVTDHHHPAAVMTNGGDTVSDSPRSSLITRRRSKRCRRSSTVESVARVAGQSPEQDSSDSEIYLVEEVARILVNLSRGKWSRMDSMEDLVVHEDELDGDDDDLLVSTLSKNKKGKFRCDTCKKVFRSYQALGGHRSSHKKKKGIAMAESESGDKEEGRGRGRGSGSFTAVGAGFKCPFCHKMFESGQALGGHKKVHFPYLPVAAPAPVMENSLKQAAGGDCMDLKRPADEMSDGEVSIATAIEAEESYW